MKLRQKKKFIKISAALAVATSAIVVPLQTQAQQNSFSDLTPSQYFYGDVLNLQERGIINGFSDGTFKPNASLTRGQAAKIIAGVLQLDTKNVENPNFKDIDTAHPYYGAIAALKQAGIIDGYTDGTFKPGETLQRNHVAKILANALKLQAKHVKNLPFTDVNASYKEAIAALYENNVTTGKTETTFDGKAFVTRGQMAAFIVRAEKAAKASTEDQTAQQPPVVEPEQPSEQTDDKNPSTNETVTDSNLPSSGGAGIGGNSSSSQTKSISGEMTALNASNVTIDGKTYTVDTSLQTLFASEAMKDASVTVTVNNKKIVKVTALTVQSEGTLNAGNATIEGNVTIDADNVRLANTIIKGDVALTNAVTKEVNFDAVTIEGKLITAAEQKAVAKARMFVAAVAPIAAETKVRLKITFTDSTVAYLEIKQKTDIEIGGFSTLREVSLKSDSSIKANENAVLPKITISEGATNIVLNASIGAVEITSEQDVVIEGKGNFAEVKVDVPNTAKVTLATEGTIKDITTNQPIELGKEVAVGTVKATDDSEKTTEQLISNYAEVEDQIKGEDLEYVEQTQYLVAKLMGVEKRPGYVAMHVQNAENYTIKYRQVKRHANSTAKIGDIVPADAKVYNTGDQFIYWNQLQTEVYKVDNNDKVVDVFKIEQNGVNNYYSESFEVIDNQIVFKSTASPLDSIMLSGAYFTNNNHFVYIDEQLPKAWKADEDGIPTLTLPLPTNFEYDAKEQSRLGYEIGHSEDGHLTDSTGTSLENAHDPERKSDIFALYELIKRDDANTHPVRMFMELLMMNSGSEYKVEKDEDGNETGYQWVHNFEPLLFNKYIEQLKVDHVSNSAELLALIKQVNVDGAKYLSKVEEVTKAIEALLKPNYHSYERINWLADGVTDQQLLDAEKLFGAMDGDFNGKEHLQYLLDEAFQVNALQKQALNLQTLAKEALALTDDTERNVAFTNIIQIVNNIAIQYDEQGNAHYLTNYSLTQQYIEKLAETSIQALNDIVAVVETVNNSPQQVAIEEAQQAVNALFVANADETPRYEKLAAGVTVDVVDTASQLVNALPESIQQQNLVHQINTAKAILQELNKMQNMQQMAKDFFDIDKQMYVEFDLTYILNNVDSVNVDDLLYIQYIRELAKNNYNTPEKIKAMIQTINANYPTTLQKKQQAMNVVEQIFVMDDYGYPTKQLQSTVTLEQIRTLKTLIDEVNTTAEELNIGHLQSNYTMAKVYYAAMKAPEQLEVINPKSIGNDTTVQLTFNEAIQGTDLLVDFDGINVEGVTATIEGEKLIFTFDASSAQSAISVTIDGVKDAQGNAIKLEDIILHPWARSEMNY